jgi:hypothetical protein
MSVLVPKIDVTESIMCDMIILTPSPNRKKQNVCWQ